MLALPREPGCCLVTTDYILDEALTLFMARGIPHQRKRLLSMVNTSAIVQLVWIGQDYFREASQWMFKYEDHPFSFTDCTSFACFAAAFISSAAPGGSAPGITITPLALPGSFKLGLRSFA